MIHHPIARVPAFAMPPRCCHWEHDPERCPAPATHWLVSPDGLAITYECEAHASAVVREYDAAAARWPAECGELAGWKMVPVVVRP